jgi:hypothetical protein
VQTDPRHKAMTPIMPAQPHQQVGKSSNAILLMNGD